MSCHFHQNLAFIAFKTADQMHSVCNLWLYTDNNRLLTRRPRVNCSSNLSVSPLSTHTSQSSKAMSTQTSYLPDLRSNNLHTKHSPQPNCYNHSHQKHSQDKEHFTPSTSSHNLLTFPLSAEKPITESSQLTLILAKLNELDDIKTHLHTLDTRLNLFQSSPLNIGMVAQRS